MRARPMKGVIDRRLAMRVANRHGIGLVMECRLAQFRDMSWTCRLPPPSYHLPMRRR